MFFNYEKYEEAFEEIAEFLDCNLLDVYDAFCANPEPLAHTPVAIKEVKEANKELLRAANSLEKAAKIWAGLPPSTRRHLNGQGAVTVAQIERSVFLMRDIAKDRKAQLLGDGRGGRNYAALYVAYNVFQLFEDLGLPIRFGHNDGKPSTQYGQAVELSLRVLEIDADWRSVTREAYALTEN
ncbi:hypothetical protein [Sulfitobacter donghicola]|uniref:Uncharacterized protein n=1 Tax=Sulfitobacter donghicola DSW-25 = KCTC 12864 = JCM 14565 TaxID=1300350 RepID=A0A073IND7_9RHOB|nr:hypothetical protein [Sulfitobacter donghicola]KEJ91060.1 hypothetical protein DSW25_02030 [Sulfitobacter donghicola DSW-25 = KCTC 12864 = JCM 14565]